MTKTMKAAVIRTYGSPDVLSVEQVERPVPKDHEVLVRIHATTVGATDPVFRKGKPLVSRLFTGIFRPKIAVPGDVLAGEVEEVGRNVKSFKKGDQVFGSTGAGMGAHAEYKCLPEDGAIATKPEGLDYAESAAICDGALTALPFLRDNARIQAGQKVLVNGASGSVGSAAVQLARYYGAEVTGVCSTSNVELVKSLGADRVIDYTREDFTRTGDSYDIIFDAVGKCSYRRCANALTLDGIYLTTVLSLAIILQMAWTSKVGRRRAVIAFTGLRPPADKAKDLVFLKGLLEQGKLKPVIDRRYPLEKISEAHAYVETGRKKGNVVLSMRQEQ